MSKDEKNSSVKSTEHVAAWEKMLQRLDEQLRASGRTVTVREGSDSDQYEVRFPQGKSPAAEPQSDTNAFVVPRPARRSKARQTGGTMITVEWGYDSHSITLNPGQWAGVLSGEPLGVKGPGYYYEAALFQDYWDFEGGLDGSLSVSYGDDGAEGFNGTLRSARIQEVPLIERVKRSSKKTRRPAAE